jgi:uncharacterized protein
MTADDPSLPRTSPSPVVPLIRQLWRDVAFAHWPLAPRVVQRLLPARLEADVHGGTAWVSLTCFSTTCSIGGVLPLPGPRRYPETNVRTYVRGPDGRTGLWFFSLDVTNRANTLFGRATGLPYFRADMDVSVDPELHYVGRRGEAATDPSYDLRVEPGPGNADDPLDRFLTDRWSAYVGLAGHLLRYDVAHQPWPRRTARIISLRQSLLEAAGLPTPDVAPVAHYAAEVDANLAPRRLVW